MDAIPVLSQTKSLVQFICGQREKAKQTQVNFSRQCPVVSQVRSMVEAASGDREAAKETQKECGNFLLTLLNGFPIVGHIKGGIHYVAGDPEGGDAAIKAASHTSAVMAGGAIGFLMGGPFGAVAVGIGSGAAMDATITAVETQMKGRLHPYGFLEPFADPKDAGKWCDAAARIVFDGFVGHATGHMVQQLQARNVVVPAKSDHLIAKVAMPYQWRNFRDYMFYQLKDGIVYLLNDGRLKKIKDLFSDIMKKNSDRYLADEGTMENSIQNGEFTVKLTDGIVEVFQEQVLLIFIDNNKVFITDADGNRIEIEENHVYSKCPDGRVEVISDKLRQDYIQDVIEKKECGESETCSIADITSVQHVPQDSIAVIGDGQEVGIGVQVAGDSEEHPELGNKDKVHFYDKIWRKRNP